MNSDVLNEINSNLKEILGVLNFFKDLVDTAPTANLLDAIRKLESIREFKEKEVAKELASCKEKQIESKVSEYVDANFGFAVNYETINALFEEGVRIGKFGPKTAISNSRDIGKICDKVSQHITDQYSDFFSLHDLDKVPDLPDLKDIEMTERQAWQLELILEVVKQLKEKTND